MRSSISTLLKSVIPFMLIIVSQAASGDILDANSATRDELSALPHLNEALVNTVIEKRPFTTINELNDLLAADLDDEQLSELYAKVFVPINLNTAEEEDILLIPGVGSRMAHEFEEYRPYSDLQQFRREIGKYVDADEVARLEQYVTLD